MRAAVLAFVVALSFGGACLAGERSDERAAQAIAMYERAEAMEADDPRAARAVFLDAAGRFAVLGERAGTAESRAASWTNAGHAWLAGGAEGRAIHAWRRALWHEPGWSAARGALERVRPSQLRGRGVLAQLGASVSGRTGVEFGRLLAVVGWTGAWVALACVVRARGAAQIWSWRGLRVGLVVFALGAGVIAAPWLARPAGDAAIALDGRALRTAPDVAAGAMDATLGVGETVAVLGRSDGWALVERRSGTSGWVRAGDVAMIAPDPEG